MFITGIDLARYHIECPQWSRKKNVPHEWGPHAKSVVWVFLCVENDVSASTQQASHSSDYSVDIVLGINFALQ